MEGPTNLIHLEGKVELQAVGNVMNRVKGSKGIIDILLSVSISILLVRISVFQYLFVGLRIYKEPAL